MSATTTPTPHAVSVTNILAIIQLVLSALSKVPVIGTVSADVSILLQILQNAMAAYHSATGSPLDLTKIPLESPVA